MHWCFVFVLVWLEMQPSLSGILCFIAASLYENKKAISYKRHFLKPLVQDSFCLNNTGKYAASSSAARQCLELSSKIRTFKAGDRVLILVFALENTQGRGPYESKENVTDVNYLENQPDKRKPFQTYHVNPTKCSIDLEDAWFLGYSIGQEGEIINSLMDHSTY